MGLEQDFKKETGQDAYIKDQTIWNDYYIEWLESRIEQLTIPIVVVPKGTLCDYCKKPLENTCCNDCLEEMDSHNH